jgi:hypothetical protein
MRTNKWDHVAPTTGTTAADGLDLLNAGPAVAPTIDTTGAALANVTCPAGHIK